MTERSGSYPPPNPRTAYSDGDLTGRDRITRNVLASWGGEAVFVLAGFIVPRLIDQRIDREALGIWDFAWSVVAYFTLIQAGAVSSTNRYVAKFRAAGDVEGVNRVVSSITCVFVVGAGIIMALSVAAMFAVPALLDNQLAGYSNDAAWVVLLLGMGVALQIAFSGFGGVITGCHRWDLHYGIQAGSFTLATVGMVVVLLVGGGLPSLALMNLGEVAGGRVVRYVVAYRLCPGLSVRVRHARWSTACDMLKFGGKTLLLTAGDLLLNQAVNILIFVQLGPAALAVFARPRALVRHVRTFVRKFTYVLVPTASSLHVIGHKEELRRLLVQGTRYAAYIALPLLVGLAVLGDGILHVWMGPDYADGLLMAILALGFLVPVAQEPAISIMVGLNAHGWPSLVNLVAAVIAIGLTALALGPLEWGLVGAAAAVTIPLTLANGIYLPICAARRLGMRVRDYVSEAVSGPIFCAGVFALCLVGCRISCAARPLAMIVSGSIVGGITLVVLYWKCALRHRHRRVITDAVRVVWARFGGRHRLAKDPPA
ncbi:MAG: lipopolysaccharide biosynthesis protein [Planctomycetes bacterium]|nr:lipopolysaccharide biosynthesis protein [Planctomycetota bacterium]